MHFSMERAPFRREVFGENYSVFPRTAFFNKETNLGTHTEAGFIGDLRQIKIWEPKLKYIIFEQIDTLHCKYKHLFIYLLK